MNKNSHRLIRPLFKLIINRVNHVNITILLLPRWKKITDIWIWTVISQVLKLHSTRFFFGEFSIEAFIFTDTDLNHIWGERKGIFAKKTRSSRQIAPNILYYFVKLSVFGYFINLNNHYFSFIEHLLCENLRNKYKNGRTEWNSLDGF